MHVVADAHHERVAAHDLAGGLAAQDPRLSGDILFGARGEHFSAGATAILLGNRQSFAVHFSIRCLR